MQKANRLAVREYLASGKPLTELESIVLFGVPSFRDLLSNLRREGWVIESRFTTYATALRRVNEYARLEPPANLPIRDIQMTEWWVSQ